MIYYNYRKINGYNAPINIILSRRGLGKTFGIVLPTLKNCIKKEKQFVYIVENEESRKMLCQDNGSKFFSAIITFLKNNNSVKNKLLLDKILGGDLSEETMLKKQSYDIKGGVVKIDKKTVGFIVGLDSFDKVKRNNFDDVSYIIFDEFIPEKINILNLNDAYKLNSITQSVARNRNVKIYLLGNTIRLDDVILKKFGLSNIKIGEIRTIKDEIGILAVCHYVDNKKYQAFNQKSDKSVSGRLAKILEVDNLEKNEFKTNNNFKQLPTTKKSSHLLGCFHLRELSVRINVTKDYSQLYIISDYGENLRKRFTFNEKSVTPQVTLNTYFKDYLVKKYSDGNCFFEDYIVFTSFLNIIGLDNF